MHACNTDALEISEEKLNLFIDEQLDQQEMDEIRQVLLDNKSLRERVCQLNAVRELIGYAYGEVSPAKVERQMKMTSRWQTCYPVAASIMLLVGCLIGWFGHSLDQRYISHNAMVNSQEIFDYYANNIPASHAGRKIIIHVSTGDAYSLKKALDETQQLLKSYHNAGIPVAIDVVANKGGIRLFRAGTSPYAARVEAMSRNNANVQFFACARSIAKARKKEGKDFAMLPHVHVAKTARELISEQIDKGWVYIKV